MTGPRWPIASWLVTLSLVAVAVLSILATLSVDVPDSWAFRGSAGIFAVACGTIGAIVARRRPGNRIGSIFCVIGLLFGIQALIVEYIFASVLVVPGGLPLTDLVAWILVWLWVPAIGLALIFLPLLFPTGHLLSPRWRLVVAYSVGALIVFGATNAFIPGPIDQARVMDNPLGMAGIDAKSYNARILGPSSVVLGVGVSAAGASLILRFMRASGDLRQQIKWFTLAIVGTLTIFTVYGFATISGMSGTILKVLEIAFLFALVSIPTAAGLAILRYRLYDIDRIISRSIAYVAVSAVLVASYGLLILVLQGPLGAVTGGDTISVALSTLVVAALFQPLRRRVQTVVDRRFDRARIDAERTSTAFAERLRDEVDIEMVVTDLDSTVRAVLRPASISLWLREGGR